MSLGASNSSAVSIRYVTDFSHRLARSQKPTTANGSQESGGITARVKLASTSGLRPGNDQVDRAAAQTERTFDER